jgi:thymidylate synthase
VDFDSHLLWRHPAPDAAPPSSIGPSKTYFASPTLPYISLPTVEELALLTKHRQVKNNPDYILMDFDQKLELVLRTGSNMIDRTGVGVRYLPGISTTMDISSRIPIPTRRKTNWKSMLKEYLWFLTGSDNINDLNKMGSKVWDFWKDDKFTEAGGFDNGSIGYGYGPNLIHYGGDLKDLENNPGVNQIEYVLNELRTNPFSRRILFTFWRPDKIGKLDCKLPPCHHTYQFVVEPDETGEMTLLSCVMYARSTDAFVGALATNLQGAAFYTHMIAQQVGMTPNTLTFCSGHFHIYNNHIPLVEEYLARPIVPSPILKLNKAASIYDYVPDDFTLSEYEPLPAMRVPIAV